MSLGVSSNVTVFFLASGADEGGVRGVSSAAPLLDSFALTSAVEDIIALNISSKLRGPDRTGFFVRFKMPFTAPVWKLGLLFFLSEPMLGVYRTEIVRIWK